MLELQEFVMGMWNTCVAWPNYSARMKHGMNFEVSMRLVISDSDRVGPGFKLERSGHVLSFWRVFLAQRAKTGGFHRGGHIAHVAQKLHQLAMYASTCLLDGQKHLTAKIRSYLYLSYLILL